MKDLSSERENSGKSRAGKGAYLVYLGAVANQKTGLTLSFPLAEAAI